MWHKGLHRWLLILTIFAPMIEGTPTHIDGRACVLTHSQDLVKAFDNIQTMLECRKLCEETEQCNFFNYFTLEGTYNLKCYLLSSCGTKAYLEGSEIGTVLKEKDTTCSLPVESKNGQLIRNEYAKTELSCKHICRKEDSCSLYSYFKKLKDCQLLRTATSFQTATIKDFHTGPPNCTSESGECTFALLDSKSKTHMLVEKQGKNILKLRSGIRHCNVTLQIVVIGQGGLSGKGMHEDIGRNSGGGSGYISRSTVTVQPNVDIAVHLDQRWNGGKNTVYIPAGKGNRYGKRVAWAESGQNGSARKGGDGYSGGGYPCKGTGCSDGGMAGGNGTGLHPGMGSGLDVSTFNIPYFNFTAGPFGDGGEGDVMVPPDYHFVRRGIYGGGGGGILVNGRGPPLHYRNNGYGAGAGFISKWDWGCAMFAIVNP